MNVRRNTMRMMERRGYDTSVSESTDDYIRTPDSLIVFVPNDKVGVAHMKNILSLRIDSEKIFIIHANTLTSEARNTINNSEGIETFTYDELGFDILDVVPLHSRVDGPKPKDWKLYPVILSTDAACRYFGFKKGDVVRIPEDDGTISYRRCA